MAHGGILVLSLPLLVVLILGFLLSTCRGRRYGGNNLPSTPPHRCGAVARLQCSSSAPGVTVKGTTDKNGYFLIQTNKVTNYGAHKCRVFLESSPLSYCNVPVYPAGKRSGAHLKFERNKKLGSGQQALYTAGGFAFAPAKGSSCPHGP